MSLVSAPADRRFRRAHVKPARKRGRWRSVVWSVAAIAVATGLAASVVYVGKSALAKAQVLRIDRIVVHGNERLSSSEVMALLHGLRGENVIWVDLEAWRRRLLESSWVLDATLRRSLPSTIEVTMSERRPIGVARLGGDLYLVDDHGVVIDVYGPRHASLDLPIIDGLTIAQGRSPAVTDEPRAELAARVILALGQRPDLAGRVSQVDVTDRHNVGVILSGDPTVLHLGDDQFLTRLESYIELAEALRERVPDIDYADLRFEGRIYVGPGTARSDRMSAVPVSSRGSSGVGQGRQR